MDNVDDLWMCFGSFVDVWYPFLLIMWTFCGCVVNVLGMCRVRVVDDVYVLWMFLDILWMCGGRFVIVWCTLCG